MTHKPFLSSDRPSVPVRVLRPTYDLLRLYLRLSDPDFEAFEPVAEYNDGTVEIELENPLYMRLLLSCKAHETVEDALLKLVWSAPRPQVAGLRQIDGQTVH